MSELKEPAKCSGCGSNHNLWAVRIGLDEVGKGAKRARLWVRAGRWCSECLCTRGIAVIGRPEAGVDAILLVQGQTGPSRGM